MDEHVGRPIILVKICTARARYKRGCRETVSSGAKCTKNQRFEIARLRGTRELPSVDLVAKFGCTANPVKAGLWPPPPAADGLDRVCRPAVVCHHEIDGKVWPRGNFKPLVFVYFQAAVDKPSGCVSARGHRKRGALQGRQGRQVGVPVVVKPKWDSSTSERVIAGFARSDIPLIHANGRRR